MDALVPDDVLRRIWSEYAEMPGLSVTVHQAQRLWGLDAQTCSRALEVLTEAGFLRKTDHLRYIRATDGRAVPPRLRMAKADSPIAEAARALLRGDKSSR